MCSEPTSPRADGMIADPQVGDADSKSSVCPASLDCGDLAETFRTDKGLAVHLLKTLTPTQFTLQALAYTVYLNQLHCLDLGMNDILAGCQRGLGFDTH